MAEEMAAWRQRRMNRSSVVSRKSQAGSGNGWGYWGGLQSRAPFCLGSGVDRRDACAPGLLAGFAFPAAGAGYEGAGFDFGFGVGGFRGSSPGNSKGMINWWAKRLLENR